MTTPDAFNLMLLTLGHFTPEGTKNNNNNSCNHNNNKLISSLTDFVNLLLTGNLLLPVREIIFGRRLVALQTIDGGIRQIAIGYTLRRLAAKCANNHIIERRSNELSPLQVGVDVAVAGGLRQQSMPYED